MANTFWWSRKGFDESLTIERNRDWERWQKRVKRERERQTDRETERDRDRDKEIVCMCECIKYI